MKRFDIDTCCGGPAYLVGNPDGKYVKYEEVAALEAERNELRAALERVVRLNPDAGIPNEARAVIAKVEGGEK